MNHLPNRKTPRAKWHTYSGAEYFVTICTQNREHYFGHIIDGVMNLSAIGEFLKTQIENTETIRCGDVSIPLYCIMPNHIHLIVFVAPRRDASNASVPNTFVGNLSNSNSSATNSSIIIADARSASLQPHCQFGMQSHNLGSVIRGLKSAVTKFANDNGIAFGWQSRYHDHIIRNQLEMNNIADYIQNNPLHWQSDCFNIISSI